MDLVSTSWSTMTQLGYPVGARPSMLVEVQKIDGPALMQKVHPQDAPR